MDRISNTLVSIQVTNDLGDPVLYALALDADGFFRWHVDRPGNGRCLVVFGRQSFLTPWEAVKDVIEAHRERVIVISSSLPQLCVSGGAVKGKVG